MIHVIDNLYIGNIQDYYYYLYKYHIEAVLKLTNLIEEPKYTSFNNIEVLRIIINDEENFMIIDKCIEFINKNKKKNILIQCSENYSRSLTVIISYLIKERRFTYKNALKLFKNKINIYINKTFDSYLKSLDPNEEKKCLICHIKYYDNHECEYKKCECGNFYKIRCLKKCDECNQNIKCEEYKEHVLYCY